MKIKFTEQIEKEVEVKLPAFRKSTCHFYRVLSETDCTQITILGGHYSITQVDFTLAFSSAEKEITEEEFNEALKKVFKIFKI